MQSQVPGKGYSLVALAASTAFVITVVVAGFIYWSRSPGVDFASFWAAGRLALDGRPALAYDVDVHRAVEMTVAHMRGLMPFPYPPPFLFAVAPVGFHPFWLAYLLWMAATAGLFAIATRPYLPAPYAFAHPAAIVNAVIGQNGFLTAGIFLSGMALLAAQPFAAGAVLGLLVIKPQLAILLPVALIAAREWRAIAGGAVSTTVIVAAAALVFGLDSYSGFLATSGEYAEYMAADRWNWAETASIFGFCRFLGVPQSVALGAQGVVAVAAAVVTWRAWADDWDQRAAVLAAAALLVPPYVFTYDSLLLALPIALLLRDNQRRWRVACVWLLLLLPLLAYFDIYPGPNTVPIAAALCVYWLAAEGKKKAAAPSGTAAPFQA